MGIFWSSPPRQNESISRQKLQQSTLKEIAQMEHCIHCYQDSRLGLLLGPYVRQNFPWELLHIVTTLYTLNTVETTDQRGATIAPKANFKIMRLARFSMDYMAKPQVDANVHPQYPI